MGVGKIPRASRNLGPGPLRDQELAVRGDQLVRGSGPPTRDELDTSTGELLLAFGGGMFVFPHALHVDAVGNVWVADLR